jgi:hypothetical protein
MLGSELVYGPVTAGTPITAGAGTIASSGAEIIVSSPVTVADPSLVSLELDSGAANSAPLGTSPRAAFHSSSLVPVLVMAQGAFVAMDPAQLPNLLPYTWQAAVPNTGWANAAVGGRQTLELRIGASDDLVLYGALDITSITPNVTAFTIPVGYRIAKATNIVVIQLSSAGAHKGIGEFLVNASGGVAILTTSFAGLASGDIFIFNSVLQLGNLA